MSPFQTPSKYAPADPPVGLELIEKNGEPNNPCDPPEDDDADARRCDPAQRCRHFSVVDLGELFFVPTHGMSLETDLLAELLGFPTLR